MIIMDIVVENLTKSFRRRTNFNPLTGVFNPKWAHSTAVDNISFQIKAGESVAFLGPNGAGKTTTTKMMTGLICPTSGSVTVGKYKPFDRNYDFLRKIGLVMGNKSGLNWDLSPLENFLLLQKIYGIEQKKYQQTLDNLVEVLDVRQVLNRQVRSLSLGERMKCELIGSILHDPDVLFLDEPTIGLDISSKLAIRKFLISLHKRGKTLILTSHDLEDITEVSNRVIMISKGKKIYDDSLLELTTKYGNEKIIKTSYANSPDKQTTIKRSELSKHLSELAKDSDIIDISIQSTPIEKIITDLLASG
jgi:ABC-2 type transport system ATP-binding protein